MRMLQARYAEPWHASATEGCDGLDQHLRSLGGPRLMYVIPAHEIALAAGALGGEAQNAVNGDKGQLSGAVYVSEEQC